MTLLITIVAAVIVTIVWRVRAAKTDLQLRTLALTYWGASLMWFVDVIFEFFQDRDGLLHPAKEDVISDAWLGLCVVALGVIIWLVLLLKRNRGTKNACKA